jgi:hypothetical protein
MGKNIENNIVVVRRSIGLVETTVVVVGVWVIGCIKI